MTVNGLREEVAGCGDAPGEFWDFQLYILGHTARSLDAVINLKKLCEDQLCGRYRVEIIDVLERPDRANEDQIMANPTLIRRWPLPVRRVIGDLSDTDLVLAGLGIRPRSADRIGEAT